MLQKVVAVAFSQLFVALDVLPILQIFCKSVIMEN